MNKYTATMAKCTSFDEWVTRFLRVDATDDHRRAWDDMNAPKPARRRRRTKAEMEAAREETD